MKKQQNSLLQIKDFTCPDACLSEAIMKLLTKHLAEFISSDPGNTLTLGTDKKLKV